MNPFRRPPCRFLRRASPLPTHPSARPLGLSPALCSPSRASRPSPPALRPPKTPRPPARRRRDLIGESDIDGAMEEAEWCVESLRQVRQQRTLSVFPDAGGRLRRR